MKKRIYLAFDLGASSGRLMSGCMEGDRLVLSELYRFPNQPVYIGRYMYWDFPYLLAQMKEGLKKAAELGDEIACIGIDTWGVDYGYIGKDGSLLGLPFCYRDAKNDAAMKDFPLDEKRLYEIAGLQRLSFNTLYQLYSDLKDRPFLLEAAHRVLLLPDLLGYYLTGVETAEYTIASTTGMLDARSRVWSGEIMDAMGFPRELLPEVTKSGSLLGTLLPSVQAETGLGPVPVASVCGHDTASAVAGIPFTGPRQAFLSSGTWSLMGARLSEPLISDSSRSADFTNEGAADYSIKFLKNICGLWIIQQLKKEWQTDYPAMIGWARESLGTPLLIDPDDAGFTAPRSMEQALLAHLEKTGQPKPQSRGELLAAVYQGLAARYQSCREKLEELLGYPLEAIHMVGGGIQDTLLCDLTQKATGLPVVTGPVEAAALGNILLQQRALGELESLEEGQRRIGESFPVKIYKGE